MCLPEGEEVSKKKFLKKNNLTGYRILFLFPVQILYINWGSSNN